MKQRILPYLAAALVLASAVVPATAFEPGASWLRSRVAPNTLMPRMSAIGDFTWEAGPRGSDGGARLRELEFAIQAEADTYARFDGYIAFPGAGGFGGHAVVEVEEAYATLTSLPWGLTARGGKFLANFGRLNLVHTHELDQVTRPLALTTFLGDEGINSVGAELSASTALGENFIEVTYGLLNDLGVEAEEKHVEVTAPDGSTVEVEVHEDDPGARRRVGDFAHAAKLRVARDVGADATVDMGLSGALHQARLSEHRSLGAVDMTLRWKPAREGLYKSFLWRSEFLLSRRVIPESTDINSAAGTITPGFTTHRRGAYTYAEYQAAQRWRFGARLDYAENATTTDTRSPTRAVSPYVTWNLTEFNRLRLQYEYRTLASRAHENRAFLQWTLVLGPHGAHPF